MAPEMALGYVVGWVPSAVVTGFQFRLHRQKVKAPGYRLLQTNLRKADLIWRESRAAIEPFREGKEEHDLKLYEKNLLLMGGFFLIMSWAGFIFNMIVLFSMHYLAVSRFERRVFASPLLEKEIPGDEVLAIVAEIKSL